MLYKLLQSVKKSFLLLSLLALTSMPSQVIGVRRKHKKVNKPQQKNASNQNKKKRIQEKLDSPSKKAIKQWNLPKIVKLIKKKSAHGNNDLKWEVLKKAIEIKDFKGVELAIEYCTDHDFKSQQYKEILLKAISKCTKYNRSCYRIAKKLIFRPSFIATRIKKPIDTKQLSYYCSLAIPKHMLFLSLIESIHPTSLLLTCKEKIILYDLLLMHAVTIKPAARKEALMVAELLLEIGANPNKKWKFLGDFNTTFEKALHVKNNLPLVRLFLKYNPKIDVHKSSKQPFLASIILKNNIELIKLLLDYQKSKTSHEEFVAFVNREDRKGKTALFEAVKRRNLNMIQLLIDNGADINAQDEDGKTPLIVSLINNNDDMLFSRFIAKTIVSYLGLGFSAAHLTAAGLCYPIVFMLLTKDADPFLKDYQGNNAFFYLKEHADDIITELISRPHYTDRIDFPIFLRYPLHAKDQFEEFLNEYNPKAACALCKRSKDTIRTRMKRALTCKKCQVPTYCSRKCQKLHWKQEHGKYNYILLGENSNHTLVRCIDKHKRHVAYIPKSKIPAKYRNSTSGTVALKVCFVYKILKTFAFKNRLSEKPVTQISG